MFGSAALELAIGLVFIFVLVSLLVSAATELLASWLRWRASNLWKGLRGMLGVSAQQQVYNHPLVKTLLTPTTGPPVGLAWLFRLPGLRRLWPIAKGPSYIPPRIFACALLDLIDQPYQAIQQLVAAIDAAAHDSSRIAQVVAVVRTLPDFPGLASSLSRVQRLAEEVEASAGSAERVRSVLLQLRHEAVALSQLPGLFDRDLQGALRPLLASSGGDEAQMRAEVETWFNDMADRTAGWYKRKTQAVQLILGLLLAIWIDVDVLLISRALWADSTLRATLVAQAEAATKESVPQTTEPVSPDKHFEQVRGRILTLGLPLRGTCVAVETSGASAKPLPWWCEEAARSTTTLEAPLVGSIAVNVDPMRWLGWLLTAVAASFGAPFWFDMLQRVTTIRSSGRPPEERPTQTTVVAALKKVSSS